MSIEIAMRRFALLDPGIRGLVVDRIFLNQAPPDGKFPRIVTQLISEDNVEHFGKSSGLIDSLYQWSIMGMDSIEVKALSLLVKNRFNSFTGRLPVAGGQPISVTRLHIETVQGDYEPAVDSSEDGIHILRQDYSVWYREPVPA